MAESKHPISKQTIKELLGFPRDIPISFNKLNVGTITIDFDVDKTQKSTSEKRFLIVDLLKELSGLAHLIKDDIEVEFRRGERFRQNRNSIYRSIAIGYMPSKTVLDALRYIFYEEEEMFELIKTEGPISLLNSSTQRIIKDWMSDKKIAGHRINMLKDSLMEYTYGPSFRDVLLTPGRPQIDVIRKFGTKWLRDLYYDLTSILGIAKRIQRSKRIDDIKKLLELAYSEFIVSLKSELHKNPESRDIQQKLNSHDVHFKFFGKDIKFPFAVSTAVLDDEDLRTEFIRNRWEPNKLSKEIIAKIFDISISKIEGILYR